MNPCKWIYTYLCEFLIISLTEPWGSSPQESCKLKKMIFIVSAWAHTTHQGESKFSMNINTSIRRPSIVFRLKCFTFKYIPRKTTFDLLILSTLTNAISAKSLFTYNTLFYACKMMCIFISLSYKSFQSLSTQVEHAETSMSADYPVFASHRGVLSLYVIEQWYLVYVFVPGFSWLYFGGEK